ncbi:unnamed protein product [Clavelina lepadiformis]|uniref:Uncharacterized protein n=1 Tax=Clavelina lepadiformis TaxID=159417 RepID=A0ABP0FWB2_CLALP
MSVILTLEFTQTIDVDVDDGLLLFGMTWSEVKSRVYYSLATLLLIMTSDKIKAARANFPGQVSLIITCISPAANSRRCACLLRLSSVFELCFSRPVSELHAQHLSYQ